MLLSIFFLLRVVKSDPCSVLGDSVYANGKCLKLLDVRSTWLDAKTLCALRMYNGVLAEPITPEERNATITLMQGNSTPAWLGASDLLKKGTFVWTESNTPLSTDDSWWASKQPDNTGGKEDCVHIPFGGQMRLNNANCAVLHLPLCQTTVNLHQYVAVLPKLSPISSLEGYLQVTAGYSSFVYAQVVYGDMGIKDQLLTLNSEHALLVNLSSSLSISDTGISSSYVEIRTDQPVTVNLYIIDKINVLYSSTAVFPTKMLNGDQSATSYVLFSAVPGIQGNSLSVLAMSSVPTDVTVVFNRPECGPPALSLGQVHFRNFDSFTATLTSKYDVMSTNLEVNFDGAVLSASQPVAVFLGSLEILPTSYIGAEYVTFPSNPGEANTKDTFKFVAVSHWTWIEVVQESGNETGLLVSVGDVLQKNLDPGQFYYVRGNTSFYAYKVYTSQSGENGRSCVTPLLPSSAWRTRYDLDINLEMLSSLDLFVYIIVETRLAQFFEVDGVPTGLNTCSIVKGSIYSGCYIRISTATQSYYHIGLGNNQNKFGAYMFATNSLSAMCHPLGISDTLEPSENLTSDDRQRYLDRLIKKNVPQTCDTTTTTTTTPTTTTQSVKVDESSSPGVTERRITSVTVDLNPTRLPELFNSSGVQDDPRSLWSNLTKISKEELVTQLRKDIIKALHVDDRNTSAYLRTKISVPDYRTSSVAVGSVGLAFFVTVFGLVLLSDLIGLLHYIISFIKAK